eukprot:1161173-Pelagomonas_calceolata.AAC.1
MSYNELQWGLTFSQESFYLQNRIEVRSDGSSCLNASQGQWQSLGSRAGIPLNASAKLPCRQAQLCNPFLSCKIIADLRFQKPVILIKRATTPAALMLF